jgi:pimeloyl-ACP methyl ester carboxylesterase
MGASMTPGKMSATQLLRTGSRLGRHTAGGDERRPYFLYVPSNCRPNSPVFIAVHGIQGDALGMAHSFVPLAERMGCVLIAPLFSREIYFDYMRLACDGRGLRPDTALGAILEEVHTLTGVTTSRYHMFGFSGGAQFVHRYLMAWPGRVERAVLASPGWFTFPDITTPFPHGLRQIDALPDLQFKLPELLSVPVSVLVGEHDVVRDKTFMKSERLDHGQGINRMERAKRWVRHMSAAAHAYNLDARYDFQVLPGARHSFEHCMNEGDMGKMVFDFLFGGD